MELVTIIIPHVFFFSFFSFFRSRFTLASSAAEAAFPRQEGRQYEVAVTQAPGANTLRASTLQPLTTDSPRRPSPARPAPSASAVPQEFPGEVQAKHPAEQSKSAQRHAKQ